MKNIPLKVVLQLKKNEKWHGKRYKTAFKIIFYGLLQNKLLNLLQFKSIIVKLHRVEKLLVNLNHSHKYSDNTPYPRKKNVYDV